LNGFFFAAAGKPRYSGERETESESASHTSVRCSRSAMPPGTRMNDSPKLQQQTAETAYEAKAPRHEPVLNLPPVVLVLIGVCVIIYVVDAYLLSADDHLFLYAAFSPQAVDVNPAALVTLFTYAFLHGSIAHVAVNMIWLAAFGSPLANRLGTGRFLAFWALTSAAAAAFYWLFHMWAPVVLVGASGAISGMMGAAARFGFRIDRSHGKAAFSGAPLPIMVCLRLRAVVTFLSVWMLINLLTGFVSFTPGVSDQIAWEAHIGGFLAGFLGIDWFVRRRRPLPPLEAPDEDEEIESEEPPRRGGKQA
jgi:membrane associated rhomboid family serine protease